MKCYNYAILGGGPSGLSVAHALLRSGCKPDEFVVIEKENDPGGLCRSSFIDGAPLDIGGGHFLDLGKKEVLDFLFSFMPCEEWTMYERISKIQIHGMEVNHPLEANLWQFPIEVQTDYLESIAQAGCVQGNEMPDSFSSWIRWKFGERIAQDYMLPYNQKIWSVDLDELGTYWLYKLPNVSFRETILSCLGRKSNGILPAHGTFLYPKAFGYGEIWQRMGKLLGDSLITDCPVENIDLFNKTINGRWKAKTIISTIPWTIWPESCVLPREIATTISELKNASIDIDYYPVTLNSDAHWTYIPDKEIPHHRLLIRSNFIAGSRGYWTETNAKRSLKNNGVRFHNEYAYPLSTKGKPQAVKKILDWGLTMGIVGLGRWGLWEHMNSDIAVFEALKLAKKLIH